MRTGLTGKVKLRRVTAAATVALVSGHFAGCAGPRATSGLLERDLPTDTLSKPGDLGIDAIKLATGDFVLPSGLRVAYETTPARGMVGVYLTIDAGSTADPPDKEGLAHYAEHLVFRDRPRGIELSSDLSLTGAEYNAETSLDHTMFYALAPEAALPTLLGFAGNTLLRPLQSVDAEAAALELDVVRNELLFRNESGMHGQVRGWLQAALTDPAHPYRRPVAGTVESLARITLTDARQFVQRHYRPERATLVVVGNLDRDAVQRLVDQHLPAAVRGNPAKPVDPVEAPTTVMKTALPEAEAPAVHQAAVPIPEIWLGYTLPGKFSSAAGITRVVTAPPTEEMLRDWLLRDDDVLAVQVFPLHDRRATTLIVRIVLGSARRRHQIAQSAVSYLAGLWLAPEYVDPKVLESPVMTQAAAMARLETVVYTSLQRERLLQLRRKAIAHTLMSIEAWMGRGHEHAEYAHVTGKSGALLWAIQETVNADAKTIGQYARQFLNGSRARAVYLDPLPLDRQPRPATTGVMGAAGESSRPIADKKGAVDTVGDPTFAPAPREVSEARTLRLENGLTVAIVRRPQFPIVTAALAFAGGSPTGEPRGVVDRIRRIEGFLGASMPENGLEVLPFDGHTFTADVVRGGRRNLSNALYLLAQKIVRTDNIDWDEALDPDKREGKETVIRRLPHERAESLLRNALFGEHPLGQLPGQAELMAVGADDIKRWLPRMRSPRGALLVVVGDVEPAEAERLARAWFGPWRGKPDVALPSLSPPPAPAGRTASSGPQVVHMPGASRTELVFACRLPPPTPHARVTYEMLSGLLGSELLTMLRHRAGVAYSVSGNLRVVPGAASLEIATSVDTRRLTEVLAATREAWARLGKTGFDGGRLSQARWNQAKRYNLSFQTSAEIAAAMIDRWSLGWPLEAVDRLPEELRAVTAAELDEAFATCRDTLTSVAIGEEAMITKALGGAGVAVK